MGDRLADDVRREAEQEAGDERRGRVPRQAAGEEKRRPRRERRCREGGEVVGEDGPERLGHRGQHEGERRRGRDPREIHPVRHPDDVRDERIVPVRDRVRPPEKRPHEDRLVAVGVAEHARRRMESHPAADPDDREGGVENERSEGLDCGSRGGPCPQLPQPLQELRHPGDVTGRRRCEWRPRQPPSWRGGTPS